jgi:hypothetical protein
MLEYVLCKTKLGQHEALLLSLIDVVIDGKQHRAEN